MPPLTAGGFGIVALSLFQFGSVWRNVGMAVTSKNPLFNITPGFAVAHDVGSIPTTIIKTVNINYKMAELTGKVIAVLPLASGVSNRTGKEWASQDYVIEEQNARFPQRVCFKVFGSDKIQQFALQLGEIVTVKLELGCHETNGRWYNDINCWSVERAQMQGIPPQQNNIPPQQSYQSPQPPQQPQNYAPAGQWQQPAPQPQGYAPQQQSYAQQPQAPFPPQGAGYQQAPPQQQSQGDGLPF